MKAPENLFNYFSEDYKSAILCWETDIDAYTNFFWPNGITTFCGINDQLDYLVETDAVTTFDSINLQSYTKSETEEYQDGVLVKSFAVPIPDKHIDEDIELYWRVKTQVDGITAINFFYDGLTQYSGITTMNIDGSFSSYENINIEQNLTYDIADRMHINMPDDSFYNKELNSSNIYKFLKVFATEIEKLNFESDRTRRDFFLEEARESYLADNFSKLIDFAINNKINITEFRAIVRALLRAFQNSGTIDAIKSVLKYFIGLRPDIINIRDLDYWLPTHNMETISISEFESGSFGLTKEKNHTISKSIWDTKYEVPNRPMAEPFWLDWDGVSFLNYY